MISLSPLYHSTPIASAMQVASQRRKKINFSNYHLTMARIGYHFYREKNQPKFSNRLHYNYK